LKARDQGPEPEADVQGVHAWGGGVVVGKKVGSGPSE